MVQMRLGAKLGCVWVVKLKTRSEPVFDTSRDVSTAIAADHEEGRLA
jgi:hypothetical protein